MTPSVLSEPETTADPIEAAEAALAAARFAEGEAETILEERREARKAAERALFEARCYRWIAESRARHPTPADGVERIRVREGSYLPRHLTREIWQLWPDGRPTALRSRGIRLRCLIDGPTRTRLDEQLRTLSHAECAERGILALWERAHEGGEK